LSPSQVIANHIQQESVVMEVILRQAVEKLGRPGDIVKVSPGYARNYLLPRGVAYEATPGNKKRIERERQRLEAAEDSRRASAEEFATKLEQVSLTFSARVGEEGKLFGSVTSADIAQQLAEQGHTVEKRQIDLKEPIKALGVYRVPIRLHADVHPEIKVWVIKQ
jgi:large subunit ribosomal protein L9